MEGLTATTRQPNPKLERNKKMATVQRQEARKGKINKKRTKPALLIFNNRKLCDKAREYQHEVTHLTIDLVYINRKIQKLTAICKYVTDILANLEKNAYLAEKDNFNNFEELLYHIENFIFRIHAYRDKYYLFVNYALKAGYNEGENSLGNRLLGHLLVQKTCINTEIKKFSSKDIDILLKRRKLMSHKVYYKVGTYDRHLHPEISPKEVGPRRQP